jgi:hypothetical protein
MASEPENHEVDPPSAVATPDQEVGVRKSPAFRTSKRVRATLACQRCKSRKQKCDGLQPSCSNCRHGRSECHYVVSRPVRKAEQRLYIKALEERVAELESNLRLDGRRSVAEDHWDNSPPRPVIEQQDEQRRRHGPTDSLSAVIRDLALHSTGLYIGGSSNLSLGRLLGSIVQGRSPSSSTPSGRASAAAAAAFLLTGEDDESSTGSPAPNAMDCSMEQQIDPPSTVTHQPEQQPAHGLPIPETASFARPEIDELFESYMQHVSIQYPVIHSVRLVDWHNRRKSLTSPFEICVLHLTYAIGALMLKFVRQLSFFPSLTPSFLRLDRFPLRRLNSRPSSD